MRKLSTEERRALVRKERATLNSSLSLPSLSDEKSDCDSTSSHSPSNKRNGDPIIELGNKYSKSDSKNDDDELEPALKTEPEVISVPSTSSFNSVASSPNPTPVWSTLRPASTSTSTCTGDFAVILGTSDDESEPAMITEQDDVSDTTDGEDSDGDDDMPSASQGIDDIHNDTIAEDQIKLLENHDECAINASITEQDIDATSNLGVWGPRQVASSTKSEFYDMKYYNPNQSKAVNKNTRWAIKIFKGNSITRLSAIQ